MSIIQRLLQFMSLHKKTLMASLILLCVLVLGIWGTLVYRETQSPQYALKSIHKILQSNQPEQLADYIDFRGVSESMREAALPLFQIPTDNDQAQLEYDRLFQKNLLTLLRSAPDPEAIPKKHGIVQAMRPALLPELLPLQLKDGFSLLPGSHKADVAIAVLALSNPNLHLQFDLLLQMKDTPKGWQITSVLNTRELVTACLKAIQRFDAQHRQEIELYNTRMRARMNSQLDVHECRTMARTLSDGKTVLLMLTLKLTNLGPRGIDTVTLRCTLSDGKNCQHAISLSILEHAAPGTQFKGTYTETFTTDSEFGRHLLSSKTIDCSPEIRNMSLDNGEIYFFLDVPQ